MEALLERESSALPPLHIRFLHRHHHLRPPPPNWNNSTARVNRTTWASTELLAMAIVANVPTLYSLNKRRREHTVLKPSGSDQYPAGHYRVASSNSRPKPQDDEFELMLWEANAKA